MANLIHPDASLSATWLPLNRLVISECAPKDIKRVLFFVRRMVETGLHTEPPITVRPLDHGYFEILNGHHKFIAHILVGRKRAPCTIIDERV